MIAITGANGLLGSFILRKLVQEQIPVIALRRKDSDSSLVKDLAHVTWRELEILDPISVEEALEGATTVIHTAAQVSFNPRMRKIIMDVNVRGTQHVVNTCLALGIPRLIHISSVAALGRKKGFSEMDETARWVESDLNTDYAKSKYLSEVEAWRGAEEGLAVSIINPSVILAPADWSKSSAQLFRFVWQQKPFYSESLINYVDVRDVVELIWQVYSKNISGEKFIANGGHIPIKVLFDQIAQRFEKRPPTIKLSPLILSIVARWEEFRTRFAGGEPMITRQSAKVTKENFYYLNHKAINKAGVSFRSLNETLDWCCPHYKQAYTTNK